MSVERERERREMVVDGTRSVSRSNNSRVSRRYYYFSLLGRERERERETERETQ